MILGCSRMVANTEGSSKAKSEDLLMEMKEAQTDLHSKKD